MCIIKNRFDFQYGNFARLFVSTWFTYVPNYKICCPSAAEIRGGGGSTPPPPPAVRWGQKTRLFSSPEPKARVSYCRPFSSVVRRASCVVRRASCVVRRPSSVNFLHFHLLLKNAWLDFNQTWQESSLGVGDSKLFK